MAGSPRPLGVRLSSLYVPHHHLDAAAIGRIGVEDIARFVLVEHADAGPFLGRKRPWEAEQSELRRVDPQSGEVLELLAMPTGIAISGLESDGADTFFCGGGNSGKLRAVRRPRRLL